jgi:hypothetical protein
MATVETLPADQRAVLSLLLQRGRSYEQIAKLLRIDPAAVRSRALAAVAALAASEPADGANAALAAGESAKLLTAEQRAQVSDYLLGQLSPEAAAQTRAQLARSPVQLRWARAAAWELAALSSAPLESLPRASLAKPSSRRGGAILLALVAAIAVAVVLVALLSGGSATHHKTTGRQSSSTVASNAGTGAQQSSTAAQTQASSTSSATKLDILAQVNLLSQDPSYASALGVAQIVRVGTTNGMVLYAKGMPANPAGEFYAVWLSSAPTESRFLGFVPERLTKTGDLKGDTVLQPTDARYTKLLVTLETQSQPTVPGKVVLEGAFTLPR